MSAPLLFLEQGSTILSVVCKIDLPFANYLGGHSRNYRSWGGLGHDSAHANGCTSPNCDAREDCGSCTFEDAVFDYDGPRHPEAVG